MSSVTQRIAQIKQPYGGYLPTKEFKIIELNDNIDLAEEENIAPSLVGLVVDYLTRFMLGSTAREAFDISFLGASLIGMGKVAIELINDITGLDDKSIINACKLSGFDVCYRSNLLAYKPIENIYPDFNTINNIRIMVNRSLSFFAEHGPIVCSSPTFEGGYTETVTSGDGDYVTEDTLWDFKVSKSRINSKYTLQILMYYILGMHSTHEYYKKITKLGFYNPRLNKIYICDIKVINKEIINEIERDVICYSNVPCLQNSKPKDLNGTIEKSPEIKTVTTKIIEKYPVKTKTVSTTTVVKRDNTIVKTTRTYIEEDDGIDLTVTELSALSKVDKKYIYQDIKNGRLFAYKHKNKYYIPEDEASKYIDKKKNETVVVTIFTIIVLLIVIIYLLSIFD